MSTFVPICIITTFPDKCSGTCMDKCSSSWIRHEDKCYKLSKSKKSWSDAEKSCRCLLAVYPLPSWRHIFQSSGRSPRLNWKQKCPQFSGWVGDQGFYFLSSGLFVCHLVEFYRLFLFPQLLKLLKGRQLSQVWVGGNDADTEGDWRWLILY